MRIVGKGHASCFQRLLQEWYRCESFADVALLCDGRKDSASATDSDINDPWRKIAANRSVLAAASPVFAKIFSAVPLVEYDVSVTLAGYSHATIKTIISYIYTGSLEFGVCDKADVEAALQEFRIQMPAPTEASGAARKAAFEPKIVSIMSVSNVSQTGKLTINRHRPSLSNARSIVNFAKILEKKRNAAVHRDQEISDKAADVPLLPPTQPQMVRATVDVRKLNRFRKLKRNVDATARSAVDVTINALRLAHASQVVKSNTEKTVIFMNGLFPPLEQSKEDVHNNTLKRVVSTLFDVPGIFSPYRERSPFHIDIKYSTVSQVDAAYVEDFPYIPSYVDKKLTRTYGSSRRADTVRRTLRTEVKIDSVHAFKNKVHIRTVGPLLVNKESESLYEDSPLSFFSPQQTVSRLQLEHNYSEENSAPADEEPFNSNELADDMVTFQGF